MTEQQKKNLKAIFEMAQKLNKENVQKAAARGDFNTAIAIADREGKIETVLKQKGVLPNEL